MQIEKSFKGTIKNAVFVHLGEGRWWVEGNVYGHNSFPDSEWIHTSRVLQVSGNKIETLNSKYNVEWDATSPVSL
jgi:hypothetical protein